MTQGLFELVNAEAAEVFPPEFIHNFRAALLLSVLDKGLLTQQEFERCTEELQKR